MSKQDWHERWSHDTLWKDTDDFLVYREDLVRDTLQVVANWRKQKTALGKKNKNLAYFCSRLDLLVDRSGALDLLPAPSADDTEMLARRLGDLLTVLTRTNCWELHGNNDGVSDDELPPEACEGCPLVGPVDGLSGPHKYWGCDALTFIGWKLIDWRAGLRENPWPEPGVWYSAFETDRRRH
ncbi:MAG: hypothetical protein IT305_28450 [Chloroflexi bacterium]|nr:hypothetical protein [Chloroflexota bacterium]